jgi:type IV pilus biogenesis/stability protein PilW
MIALLIAIACVTPQRENRSQTRTTLGTAYLTEGNPSDAIIALEEATKLNPRNASAWEKLAIAYYARDAKEKAEKSFKKAIRLEPSKAEIHNNYGLMLMNENRVDEAIEQFTIALEDLTYRNTALVLNNLGQAYYQNHDYENSIQTLNQAIARAPNLCQSRFNRAMSYQALHNTEMALQDYALVIELCGDVATGAYYQAGLLMIQDGDYAGGCNYLQNTIREAGNSELSALAKKAVKEHCQ